MLQDFKKTNKNIALQATGRSLSSDDIDKVFLVVTRFSVKVELR